ncbi:spore germination protein [Halalkalibacter alkaliphilus]|uniref:Spore germination protein n=1 Tax=Halalkalibacter alkaliphilus TaxID=2917993 RepID=A0A9X2I8Z5_9BACI|nr:spore germination protein [Halalkalibacter alkaliphilus]MCL7748450.1 spore germination protein [Halalkalibacter alkaliphilus]
MPAIVGTVKVLSVEGSGVFNIGDVLNMSPSSTSKAYAGAGSFNTGDYLRISNQHSQTNTYDKDLNDSNIKTII